MSEFLLDMLLGGPEKAKPEKAKPTIEELERILSEDEDQAIEILPNGEIRAVGGSTSEERGGLKPLTMREDLGGEYAPAIL